MKATTITTNRFFLCIMLIVLEGGLLSFVYINYASMWADELYSALLDSPTNCWYKVLYIQSAYQPPLYAFSLWICVQIFVYNQFYIRLFILLAGVVSITISAALGKKFILKGWAPIIILVLILSVIQMLILGIIGEYLWRTLDKTRDRPSFLIDEIIE